MRIQTITLILALTSPLFGAANQPSAPNAVRPFEADKKVATAENWKTYNRLFAKVMDGIPEGKGWDYNVMRARLEKWELNFLVAMMFERIREADGWTVAGMNFLGQPDYVGDLTPREVVDAWREIGAREVLRAIRAGQAELKLMEIADFSTAGNGEADTVEIQERQLEAAMAEAYGPIQPSVHQLLHRYASRKKQVEQEAQNPGHGC